MDARPAGVSRSIPAGAGNPSRTRSKAWPARVHPRGCGESQITAAEAILAAGPSPRVRGIPGRAGHHPRRRRSIPAGAGNPAGPCRSAWRARVHPRGCGESSVRAAILSVTPGPSPRVRGIRAPVDRPFDRPGSIPAGAGNPIWAGRSAGTRRVHPRGCGESDQRPLDHQAELGPSPRVRGIPLQPIARLLAGGSIPAGAGNPICWSACPRSKRVHPRGCGESAARPRPAAGPRGPSPRVRGIPPLPLHSP